MQAFNTIQSQLGIMTWPFLLMSLLMLMLLLERTIFMLRHARVGSRRVMHIVRQETENDTALLTQLSALPQRGENTFLQGTMLLIKHRGYDKALREEIVSLWLQKQRRRYLAGLKILTIIGAVAPLLGLLGTVLGLIEMFHSLADAQGAIEPSQLAGGLGLAMSTTAAGLLIALPAIVGAQLLRLWAEHLMLGIEHALNYCNLYLEGVADTQFNRPSQDNLLRAGVKA